MPRIFDIVKLIEQTAKPGYAYEWDNCGFMAGDLQEQTERILVALDITKDVVLEAKVKGCGLIVSHHPLIFKPIRTASVNTFEGEILSLLYQNKIALYCAHTSLDIAPDGVNDAFCDTLKLRNVRLLSPFQACGDTVACARLGNLPERMDMAMLLQHIRGTTGAPRLLYGGLEKKNFEIAAVCTGAGEEFAFEAANEGADVFITGEIKYHTALELRRRDIAFVAAGHFYTERPIVQWFARRLQKQLDMLQYSSTVYSAQTHTDPFDNEGGVYL